MTYLRNGFTIRNVKEIPAFVPINLTVLFVGHRQTVQIQIRRRRMRRLVRVSTVCLQNVLLKMEKMYNTTQQPLKRKWTCPIDNSGKFHSS